MLLNNFDETYVANFNKDAKLNLFGMYHPDRNEVHVLFCPDKPELEDNMYPVRQVEDDERKVRQKAEMSGNGQIAWTIKYKMDFACTNFSRNPTQPLPYVLFYFPMVTFDNGALLLEHAPFSCHPILCEENSNVQHHVWGYAVLDLFVANYEQDVLSKKSSRPCDCVTYFIFDRNSEVYEGKLNDQALGEKLAKDTVRNPLLDRFNEGLFSENDNSLLESDDLCEAVFFELSLDGFPETAVYQSVSALYNPNTHYRYRQSGEILDCLMGDILSLFPPSEAEAMQAHINECFTVKCITGFCVRDTLQPVFDNNSNNGEPGRSKKLVRPLRDNCARLEHGCCRPPVGRVYGEDKHAMQTIRSLTLMDDGRLIYPVGYGLVTVGKLRDDNPEGKRWSLNIDAGFLPTKPQKTFLFNGTKKMVYRPERHKKILDILKQSDIFEARKALERLTVN